MELDTLDKYIKVVRAVTQSLWHAILEARAGNPDHRGVDQIVGILLSVLKEGRQYGYPLPEIDQWWCQEVLEAYDRL